MAGPKLLEKGFQLWGDRSEQLAIDEVISLYERGYAGAYHEPEEREAFADEVRAHLGNMDGAAICHDYQLAESGAGKLSLPFVFAEKIAPGLFPGIAQQRGDCVSRDEANACAITILCEIYAGLVDEVSGKVEELPTLPADGILNGVVSSEWLYWWRGYNGDGWSCDAAARVSMRHGILLRQEYPDLGIDLTRYSGGLAGRYGAKAPPENFDAVGREHPIRTATRGTSFEVIRDLIANGYGCSSCGGEGFSSTRDANGVSSRRGGWSHAMAYIGVDDRPEIHRLYGGPLILVQNSWGVWNSGPRRILGTTIDIPPGSFWARWADVRNRYVVARSSAAGWPRKKLPDLGAVGLI